MSERRSALKDQSDIVKRLIGDAEQAERREQTDGRGRSGNSGEAGIDKRGVSKATYNISRESKELVSLMAKEEHLTKNDLVEAAIRFFFIRWSGEGIDLEPYKITVYQEKRPWISRTSLDFDNVDFGKE